MVEMMVRRRSRKAGTPRSSLEEQNLHRGEGQGLWQELLGWGRKGKVERGRVKGRWWKKIEGEEGHFFDQEIHNSR